MSGPLRRMVTIVNPQGLHFRPAARFGEAALRFASRVSVSKDNHTVDGKFWPDLMLLEAALGTRLMLEVEGDDAATAIETLAELLESNYEESEPIA